MRIRNPCYKKKRFFNQRNHCYMICVGEIVFCPDLLGSGVIHLACFVPQTCHHPAPITLINKVFFKTCCLRMTLFARDSSFVFSPRDLPQTFFSVGICSIRNLQVGHEMFGKHSQLIYLPQAVSPDPLDIAFAQDNRERPSIPTMPEKLNLKT